MPLLLVALLLFACPEITPPKEATNEVQASSDSNIDSDTLITLTGTITYVELEGGFFGFIAKDGKKYTLKNLPKAFKKDGLLVTLKAIPIKDVVTFYQYGEYIEVSEVQIINNQ